MKKKPWAYYNEHDKSAAAWLRELIKEGVVTDGEVDERSIEDVVPAELAEFDRCHFFAGVGVWDYALTRAGWHVNRFITIDDGKRRHPVEVSICNACHEARGPGLFWSGLKIW